MEDQKKYDVAYIATKPQAPQTLLTPDGREYKLVLSEPKHTDIGELLKDIEVEMARLRQAPKFVSFDIEVGLIDKFGYQVSFYKSGSQFIFTIQGPDLPELLSQALQRLRTY